MITKKTVLSACALLLALMTLASCASGSAGQTTSSDVTDPGQPSATTTKVETTAEETTDGILSGAAFPDADYGGEVFRVYIRKNTYYSGDYIYAEDQNGDIMNDAVFRRNSLVEEKYKVKIEAKTSPTPNQSLSKDISGGTADYDLILDRRADLAACSVNGLLYDFNSVGIDYNNPWWDNNAQGYAIGKRLFLMANDVDTGVISGVRFLYFNSGMIESFNLDSPYDLVARNDWTLENFLNLLKAAHADGEADGLGVYGLLRETGASNGNHMHLIIGCGVKSSETSADGEIRQAIGDQVEKISDIIDRLRTVLLDTTLTMTYEETSKRFLGGSYSGQWDRGRGAFAAGHFLFVQNGLDVSVEFSDMPDKYGVVPNPKYTADQERYYHKVDRFAAIWGIPNTPDRIDFDRFVNVFDYWAAVSSKTVMPTYYDVTIKSRRFNDPIAAQMIDIVKSTMVYDACDVYGITINSTLDSAFTSGNTGSTLNAAYFRQIDDSIRNISNSIKKKYGN